MKRLAEFPDVVREATERRGPHAIPVYAIRLADDFHRFYHDHKVLASKGGEHESFRLALIGSVRDVVARCLDLSASKPRRRCSAGADRRTDRDRVRRDAAEDDRGVRRPREHR